MPTEPSIPVTINTPYRATLQAGRHFYETGELPVIDEECCCNECDNLDVSHLAMETA